MKKLDLKNTKCDFDIYFKQGKISDLQIQLEFCNKKYHKECVQILIFVSKNNIDIIYFILLSVGISNLRVIKTL